MDVVRELLSLHSGAWCAASVIIRLPSPGFPQKQGPVLYAAAADAAQRLKQIVVYFSHIISTEVGIHWSRFSCSVMSAVT